MRVLTITGTATDLGGTTVPGQVAPFQQNYDVIAYNPDSGTVIVATSPDNSTFNNQVTVPAGGFIKLNLNDRYVKVTTSKTVYLLGN
jgi:hypothetical protein